MIELSNVSVKYARWYRKKALENINLKVNNEKVVVMGPNGSGKTTLLKVILGLVHADSGLVRINGMDVESIRGEVKVSTNLTEVYRLMGSATGDIIRMYSNLKGYDHVEAQELIHSFGLEDILKKKIHQLSSGEQKMFGNIMSLSFSPSIILMDEPFDNVDQGRRLRLLNIIKKSDADIIINTHEFDLLDHLGDWSLYFIIEGKIFGKFKVSQLKNLYLNRGEIDGCISVIDTSFGKFSITKNSGSVPIVSARNLNSMFDEVAL